MVVKAYRKAQFWGYVFLVASALALWNLPVSAQTTRQGTSESGQGRQKVEIGIIDFPPFFHHDSNGNPSGTLVELSRKVFAELNMEPVFRLYPPARLMKNLESGATPIGMLIKHPILRGKVQYGTAPVASIELRAYWRGEFPPITSKEDLRRKNLIIMRGYGYSGWIEDITSKEAANTLSYADSHEIAFKMLDFARGDYVLDYKSPALQVAAVREGAYQSSLVEKFPVYFLKSNRSANYDNLIEKLDTILQEMKDLPQ